MRPDTPQLELGQWDPERAARGQVDFYLGLGPVVLQCTGWGAAPGTGRRAEGLAEGGREGAGGFLSQAIYKLKKACRVEEEAEQQGQLLTPEEVVDRIFLLVDENGDGKGAGLPTPQHPHFPALRPWTRPATSQPLLSSSVSRVQRGGRKITGASLARDAMFTRVI